jgi:hypothetical protein
MSLALVLAAAAGPFLYAYTCTGTIVRLNASGTPVGHWEARKLLPKDFAPDVRDGCLLNGLQYDRRSKRLLAVVPKEPTVDPEGNRNHRLVSFLAPSMRFGGSVDLPVPTSQPAEIDANGRVRFLVFSDGKYKRYETSLSPSETPALEGDAKEVPEEPKASDPASRLEASLAPDQRPVRLGLDGRFGLVEAKGGKVQVFDVRTLKRVATGRAPEGATFACLAPGGRLALYTRAGRLQAVRFTGRSPKSVAPDLDFDKTTACVSAPR